VVAADAVVGRHAGHAANVLLAGTALASLAATIAPALAATRIRSAVALRMID